MRWIGGGLLALLLTTERIVAGAWTLPHGTAHVFSGATVSRAVQRYDNNGDLVGPVLFNKLYFQNWMEYGLTDAVTVIAAPQYVTAEIASGYHVKSPSLEVGGRLLLSRRIGVLSLQGSAKTAGAFDMSTSASGQGGRQCELRLLYGTSFKAFGHDGFVDIEGAKRWIGRPRPDEFVMDTTLGLWLARDDLILLQSFATVSAGGQLHPYEPYRQFKLEASLVHRLTAHWSVQSGYFFTWAGRNTVKESGYAGTLWFRL